VSIRVTIFAVPAPRKMGNWRIPLSLIQWYLHLGTIYHQGPITEYSPWHRVDCPIKLKWIFKNFIASLYQIQLRCSSLWCPLCLVPQVILTTSALLLRNPQNPKRIKVTSANSHDIPGSLFFFFSAIGIVWPP
jgi:hypothetical protein